MKKNEKNSIKKNDDMAGLSGSFNRGFFNHHPPLIIAELGTSHNGDINKAKELTVAALEAGASCIKFQWVFADEILHPNTGEVALPGGKIRLYDRFKDLELPIEFYTQIKKYVESKGGLFLCTPFGLKSARLLQSLQPKMVKIASPELNYTSLLEEVASWGLPILLSSGVSKLSDIEKAIEEFTTEDWHATQALENTEGKKENGTAPAICLLHCVTAYPAPETDYNLRVLPNLANIFGVSVGVSDHSLDPELIPALAVSMGASVIEKHFCLSRNDPGLDDPIALEPADFVKMVQAVKLAVKEGAEKTIARFSKLHGKDRIEKILGDGVKRLAASEAANYSRTNRSIHALRDITAGEILQKNDFAVLRTEKILRPGLEPSWENLLAGRQVRKDIPAGEGIRLEDI